MGAKRGQHARDSARGARGNANDEEGEKGKKKGKKEERRDIHQDTQCQMPGADLL